jgi:hypothetical protein
MPEKVLVEKDCGQTNRNHYVQLVYKGDLRGFSEP